MATLPNQTKENPTFWVKLQMEQCYQTSLGKHEERIKPASSRESSTSPLARAMDLKVVCALSISLIIALSALAEGVAPPSKYIHVLLPCRYVWDPHPTACSQILSALTAFNRLSAAISAPSGACFLIVIREMYSKS